MRFTSIAFALAVALSLSVRAEAAPISTVIDFNSAPAGTFSSLTVGDFVFTWIGFADLEQVSSVGAANNALSDSNTGNNLGAEVTMSLANGNPFTVTQFDIINLTNPAGGGAFRVDFGGTHYVSPASQTVLRGDLADITSLRINIVSNTGVFAVDNIHVTYDDGTPAPVPEPATLSLVGLGTLGMVYGARRRKPAASVE